MKHNHIFTIFAAAGILLPAQHAAAITSPLADGISLAPKKNKKGKKGKKKKAKADKKNIDKTVALAKQIFNPTEDQKKKATEYLQQEGQPTGEETDGSYIRRAMDKEQDKIVYALLMTGMNPTEALEEAIMAEKVNYIKLLLRAPGIDIKPALHTAASYGNSEIVKLILAEPGVDVSAFSSLESAILKGDAKEVKRLLTNQCADINKKSVVGDTPLICASRLNHTEIVEMLVSVPEIDVNATNKRGNTALSEAAAEGNMDAVKLLLKTPGIDINKGATPPINGATLRDRTEILKLLLNTEGIQPDFNNLFRIAVQFNSPKVVKFLLDTTDIDPNGASPYGYSHLALAASKGSAAVVKVLLSTPGVDVNKSADESKWEPPLSMAISYLLEDGSADPEALKVLLTAPGIDANKTCPLHSVAWKCRADLAKILVSAPVINVNHVNSYNQTALHEAARNNWASKMRFINTIKTLIEAGIDVNIKDNNGKTALMLVEQSERSDENGRNEAIKLLRDVGSN